MVPVSNDCTQDVVASDPADIEWRLQGFGNLHLAAGAWGKREVRFVVDGQARLIVQQRIDGGPRNRQVGGRQTGVNTRPVRGLPDDSQSPAANAARNDFRLKLAAEFYRAAFLLGG